MRFAPAIQADDGDANRPRSTPFVWPQAKGDKLLIADGGQRGFQEVPASKTMILHLWFRLRSVQQHTQEMLPGGDFLRNFRPRAQVLFRVLHPCSGAVNQTLRGCAWPLCTQKSTCRRALADINKSLTMLEHRITRRAALQAAAAIGSALATVPSAVAAPTETPAPRLSIGMATFGFGTLTNRQLADEMAGAGISYGATFSEPIRQPVLGLQRTIGSG